MALCQERPVVFDVDDEQCDTRGPRLGSSYEGLLAEALVTCAAGGQTDLSGSCLCSDTLSWLVG